MKKIKRKTINKAIKKKRKEYIKEVKHQRRYVRAITLKCKKCKRVYKINTTSLKFILWKLKRNGYVIFVKRRRNEKRIVDFGYKFWFNLWKCIC